jgi:penicillin-binding protein 2
VLPENYTVFCPGYASFYGRTFHCWDKKGHGTVNLHAAIVHSCDVFFYTVGKALGIDRISYYAMQLGLGRRTGIDLPSEETGMMPSEEWKQRVFHQKWYAGETISVSIGQGAVTTTPLQLARTIGGIATGGIFKQPHLMMTNQPVPEIDFPLQENTTEQVTQGMYGVVNEGGTGGLVKLQGVEFCGKTGSAQVISNEGKARAGRSSSLNDNAWFVGYAPRRNPEIIVSVLVQGGEHGASAAAPVARDIVKAYYDKKSAQRNQKYTVNYQRIEFPPDHPSDPVSAQPPAQPKPKQDAPVTQPVSTRANLNP